MSVVALVMVFAVLASALGGPWELEERNFDFGFNWPDPPELLLPDIEADFDADEPTERDDVINLRWLGPVLGVLLRVAVVLAVAGAVAWVVRWVWMRFRYRQAPRPRPEPVAGVAAAVVVEPQLPVLRRGVADAQRFLTEIDRPLDAVIAAWLALEDAAESSGVRRSPAQTPTEFTVAVLDRTSADADATTELLGLYHRARFSSEPIDREDVARASACLTRLAASWEQVAAPMGSR